MSSSLLRLAFSGALGYFTIDLLDSLLILLITDSLKSFLKTSDEKKPEARFTFPLITFVTFPKSF